MTKQCPASPNTVCLFKCHLQISCVLRNAGEEGITSLDLWKQLKCNRKHLMKRMQDLPHRYGLQITQQQHGKHVLYHYVAPQHLRGRHLLSGSPQALLVQPMRHTDDAFKGIVLSPTP